MQLTKTKSSCIRKMRRIRFDGADRTDFVIQASALMTKTVQRWLREKLRRGTICGGAHWRLGIMHQRSLWAWGYSDTNVFWSNAPSEHAAPCVAFSIGRRRVLLHLRGLLDAVGLCCPARIRAHVGG